MKKILCGILLTCVTGSVLASPSTAPTNWPTLTFTNTIAPYYLQSYLQIQIASGPALCTFRDSAVLTSPQQAFSVNLNNVSQYQTQCAQSEVNDILSTPKQTIEYFYFVYYPAEGLTPACDPKYTHNATSVELESYSGNYIDQVLNCKAN